MADVPDLSKLSIQELEAILSSGQLILKVKRGEEARAKGKAFENLELIPSEAGHKHDFEKLPRDKPETYRCKDSECLLTVYNCPNCRFVPGRPHKEKYDEMRCLSGTAGVSYSCNICGDEIGRLVLAQS